VLQPLDYLTSATEKGGKIPGFKLQLSNVYLGQHSVFHQEGWIFFLIAYVLDIRLTRAVIST